MLKEIVHIVVSIAVTATLIYRAQALRTDRGPAQITVVLYFASVLTVWIVSAPTVWVFLTETTGVPNIGGLLSYGAVLASTACQQVILLHLMKDEATARAATRKRLLALAIVFAVIAVLFFIIELPRDYPETWAIEQGRENPAYMLVFMTAYLFGQINIGTLSWRLIRHAPTVWYRRAFHIVVLSSGLMGIYILARVAGVIAGFGGGSGAAWEPIAVLAVGLGSILQVSGWVVPDAGKLFTAMWAPASRRLTYRRLGPLHAELVQHAPDVVLELSDRTPMRTRLYRRVVEIRDAQWALRLWTLPGTEETARQRIGSGRGVDTDAAVEAALLASAMEAKSAGRAPAEWTEQSRTTAPADMAAELAHLRRVARAYRRLSSSSAAVPATA